MTIQPPSTGPEGLSGRADWVAFSIDWLEPDPDPAPFDDLVDEPVGWDEPVWQPEWGVPSWASLQEDPRVLLDDYGSGRSCPDDHGELVEDSSGRLLPDGDGAALGESGSGGSCPADHGELVDDSGSDGLLRDDHGELLDESAPARLERLLDRLQADAAELSALVADPGLALATGDRLVAAARRLEQVDNQLGYPGLVLINLMEAAGARVDSSLGLYESPQAFLHALHGIPIGEARARARAAELLAPRIEMGRRVEPRYPVLAEAVASGGVPVDRVQLITKALSEWHKLEDVDGNHVTAETLEIAEQSLAQQAKLLGGRDLVRVIERIDGWLNPDGMVDDRPAQEAVRALEVKPISRGSRKGTFRIEGYLTAETGAKTVAVLDPLSKPQPVVDEHGKVIEHDHRDRPARMHDAWDAVLERTLRAGDLPAHGGTPTTLILTAAAGDVFATAGATSTTPTPSESTASASTASASTGSASTGSASSGSASSGSASSGSKSSGSKSSDSKSSDSESTGSESMVVGSNDSESTGSESTGSESTGSAFSGNVTRGSASTDNEPTGNEPTGNVTTGSESTSDSTSSESARTSDSPASGSGSVGESTEIEADGIDPSGAQAGAGSRDDLGTSRRRRTGFTETGHELPIESIIALSDEAEIIRTVFDKETREVLFLGRTKRLASYAQTMALAVRDGGCSFPGCSKSPKWTQRHHIIDWAKGGPTDLSNLTLVCAFHHYRFARHGWTAEYVQGRVGWRPPKLIDPEQKLIFNTKHHTPPLIT